VLRLLERHHGRVSLEALTSQLNAVDAEAAVHTLAERGLVQARYTLVPPKPAPPRVQYVRLLADDETVSSTLPAWDTLPNRPTPSWPWRRHSGAPLHSTSCAALAGCGEDR